MKTIKAFLPHLLISLLLGLILLVYLDGRNPMMEFLTSRASKIYLISTCAVGLTVAMLYVSGQRRGK